MQQSLAPIRALNCVKLISAHAAQAAGLQEDALTYLVRTDQPPQRFCTDLTQGLHEGWTVTHAALQFAYHLGFDDVVLIGLDHRYAYEGQPNETRVMDGDDPNHFSGAYFGHGQNWDNPDLAGVRAVVPRSPGGLPAIRPLAARRHGPGRLHGLSQGRLPARVFRRLNGHPRPCAPLNPMRVSIVIRTLNEARYLRELLEGVRRQQCPGWEVETVVIDSGSTDGTVEIAREFGCVLTTIRREEFSFGRSLNLGCEASSGQVLVFVSGHCVPTDEHWLRQLCTPIAEGLVDYSYGRQLGGPESRFSECRIFEKYYPALSRLPQAGFFCNNANSALSRQAWATHRFDEELTGLEDMELAKRLCDANGRVGYVAEAAVYHYHHEHWAQVKRRFEREALALQKIMPQIHVSPLDTLRYIFSSIAHDWRHARRRRPGLVAAGRDRALPLRPVPGFLPRQPRASQAVEGPEGTLLLPLQSS